MLLAVGDLSLRPRLSSPGISDDVEALDDIRTTVDGVFGFDPEYAIMSSDPGSTTSTGTATGPPLTGVLPSNVIRCVPISGRNLGQPELFKNENKPSASSHMNCVRRYGDLLGSSVLQ